MFEPAQYTITGATAREIAASVEAALLDGQLAPGEPLPTVRALAASLGTSPATVHSAYRTLRARGLVVAGGRRGTRVAPGPAVRAAKSAQEAAPVGVRDLSIGSADPDLLPPLGPALAGLNPNPDATVEPVGEVDPRLLVFGRRWLSDDGIDPDQLTVVGGALDGIERVLVAHLRTGDRVLIEDPAYPPIRDLLLALSLTPVPVAVDAKGMSPQSLRRALRTRPAALIVVPRAQNPTGASLDAERAEALRDALEQTPRLLVVEDDHMSLVAGSPLHSIISGQCQRWAHVRSFSKILHPDLRLALMAGDETTIARVEGRQALGTRWVSRLLQGTAAGIVTDPTFPDRCGEASRIYGERRLAMIDALAEHDLASTGTAGFNVWVPVSEEAPVVRRLSEAGWLVSAGERFRLAAPPGVRITVSTLADGEAVAIAAVFADAVAGVGSRLSY